MAIIHVERLTKYFGDVVLFQNLNFDINKGEKVALVAKNGAGKTTLLSLLLGKDTPQDGEIFIQPDCVIGYLEQNPELLGTNSIYDEVFNSNTTVVSLLEQYSLASSQNDTDTIEKLSHQLDVHNVWNYEHTVNYAF